MKMIECLVIAGSCIQDSRRVVGGGDDMHGVYGQRTCGVAAHLR